MKATHRRISENLPPDELYPALDAILADPLVDLGGRQILETLGGLAHHLASRPGTLIAKFGHLGLDLLHVAAGTSSIAPEDNDRRFADPAFTENPIFRRMMQSYLAWRAAMTSLVVPDGSADWKEAEQRRFAMTLITEALAPTNLLVGNPAAIKHAFDTAGRSVVRGLRNFLDDLWNNGGMPSQVDPRPFQVGKNIAASPGAVIYRGPLCEVIQYAPRTEKVFARPTLLVPPQINKYYIMDLAPGRSFIEYATMHGIPFFTISWRNPTRAQRELGLDDYVTACEEAIAAVCDVTQSPDVNLLAVCAGGITTALTLGHLAAKRQRLVHSATLLVTMLDTSLPSMTGMFATQEGVASAIKRSRKKGVLPGDDMGRIFSWLRPNDLVWSYWVRNYLMGETPPPYDILFWNNDSTNIPAKLHEGFLDLLARNPLGKAGAVTILGTPIDLHAVKCDVYIVGGQTDHITPWRTCYRAAGFFGGHVEFVLNSSGHVQSLVCPPGNFKAHYFTNPKMAGDPDTWLHNAHDNRGTWWDHWLKWIKTRSGEERPAPQTLGSERFRALDPAPGLYVFERH